MEAIIEYKVGNMPNEGRNAARQRAYNRRKALAVGKARYAALERAARNRRRQRDHARIRSVLERYVLYQHCCFGCLWL